MLDEKAAGERPDHGREAVHAAEEPLEAAAFGGRDDVGDGGHRDDHQPAAAEALQRAQENQLRHVLRDAAKNRPGEKDQDRRLKHDLAAELIAELAIKRNDDGRAEQVGRDDPREVFEPAQIADDGRQRGRYDGLIERAEQHHEQERREQQSDRRFRFDACGVGRLRARDGGLMQRCHVGWLTNPRRADAR